MVLKVLFGRYATVRIRQANFYVTLLQHLVAFFANRVFTHAMKSELIYKPALPSFSVLNVEMQMVKMHRACERMKMVTHGASSVHLIVVGKSVDVDICVYFHPLRQ